MRGVLALVFVTGCGFSAAQQSSAGDGGIDGGGPVTIGFAEASSLEDEESGSILIPVQLSAASSGPISIAYRITGGSATSGVDYSATDGMLTFAPGDRQQGVPVEIHMDPDEATDETITFELGDPTGDAVLGIATHTLEISPDILPRVRFTATTSDESEATTEITINVALDRSPVVGVNVPFTVTGSATSPADHALASGSVTFLPQQQSKTITLPILADQLDENDETVVVTLNTGTNVVLGSDRVRTHTILDDDLPPLASFSVSEADQGEAATTVQVTVQIDPLSGRTVTIPLIAGPSSGTAGADFTYPTNLSVTIPEGQQTATFNLTVIDDELNEDRETAVVQLGASPTARVSGTPTYTLDIVDEDPLPTIQFDPQQQDGDTPEGQTGPFDYNVVLNTPSGRTVTVDVALSGPASLGSDYTVRANDIPVTIPAGALSGAIRITVIDDNSKESGANSSEDIVMDLVTPATNASVMGQTQRRHEIDDDD